jgi:hypothetical protein
MSSATPFSPALTKEEIAASREPVILRVRMRRGMLNRIKAVIEHDRQRIQESWNLSDGVREVLLNWLGQREAEIRSSLDRKDERRMDVTLR